MNQKSEMPDDTLPQKRGIQERDSQTKAFKVQENTRLTKTGKKPKIFGKAQNEEREKASAQRKFLTLQNNCWCSEIRKKKKREALGGASLRGGGRSRHQGRELDQRN